MFSATESSVENISLFIPRVHWNTEKRYIISKFACLGEVSDVDMILKQGKHGETFYTVYVHFAYWYSDPETRAFHATVLDPKTNARFYYEPTRYWIVAKNLSKPAPTYLGRKVTIDLEPELKPIPLVRQTNEACLYASYGDNVQIPYAADVYHYMSNIPITRATNESCLIPPTEEEQDDANMDAIDDYFVQDIDAEYERELSANLARDTREADEMFDMMEEIENLYM